MRRVGSGPSAAPAPVPLRLAREARVAALVGVAAVVAPALPAVAVFAVSGDASLVAALANVVSPAALVRLPDRDPRRSAGKTVSEREWSDADLVHPLHEVRPPGRRLERIRELLGHLRDLVAAHLADPDVAHGHAVAVVDGALDDEDVAAAEHPLGGQLRAVAGHLRVVLGQPERGLTGESLARLRPLLDEIVRRAVLDEL